MGGISMMKLAGELVFNGDAGKAVKLEGIDPTAFEYVKVVGAFEIDAQGVDGGRLLIRPNGLNVKYKGFAVPWGDYGQGENEFTGLYLGRVGWAQSATLS